MPTETFKNLKKEKQERILNAAKKEFSNKLFAEVSINKIVKEAGISRGSFYMYFSNKEDIYSHLFNVELIKVKNECLNFLNDNNGDVITSFKALFRKIIDDIKKRDNISFLKNVMSNMTHYYSLIDNTNDGMHLITNYILEITSAINSELIKEPYQKNIIYILEMIKDNLITCLIEIIVFNRNEKEITFKFDYKLDMLKNGIYEGCK